MSPPKRGADLKQLAELLKSNFHHLNKTDVGPSSKQAYRPKIKEKLSTTSKHFVSITSKSDDYNQINTWLRQCQKSGTPYITIKTKTKFADVNWDYINLSHEAEECLRNNSKEIKNGLVSFYHKFANEQSSYSINEFTAEYKKIEIGNAEKLASEVFEFICKFLPKNL